MSAESPSAIRFSLHTSQAFVFTVYPTNPGALLLALCRGPCHNAVYGLCHSNESSADTSDISLYIYTKPMCLKTPAEQLESSGQYLTLGQTVDPHGQPVMVRTCHVIDSRVLLKE